MARQRRPHELDRHRRARGLAQAHPEIEQRPLAQPLEQPAVPGLGRAVADPAVGDRARRQCLEHRAAPYGLTRGWCAAAENVGRSGDGGTLGGVHTAFMNSSGHRANILNARWTDLGVGVARDARGEYFVVHVFADYTC